MPGLSCGVSTMLGLHGEKNDKRNCPEFCKGYGFDFILSGKEYRVNCKPKNRMKDEYFRVQGAQ